MTNVMLKIAPPTLPSSFDLSRVIADVHTYFNPARNEFIFDYHVSGVDNGLAYLSFAMPEQMIPAFAGMLEGMAQMLNNVNRRVRSVSAQNRVVTVDEIERRKKYLEELNRVVCSKYDKYLSKGSSVNEAISLTNVELKRSNFNLTYDLVKGILRKAGKFKSKS